MVNRVHSTQLLKPNSTLFTQLVFYAAKDLYLMYTLATSVFCLMFLCSFIALQLQVCVVAVLLLRMRMRLSLPQALVQTVSSISCRFSVLCLVARTMCWCVHLLAVARRSVLSLHSCP